MITVISVKALPENAQIMMERRFCGSLTFHKVIIGNDTSAMSPKIWTNNSQDHTTQKRYENGELTAGCNNTLCRGTTTTLAIWVNTLGRWFGTFESENTNETQIGQKIQGGKEKSASTSTMGSWKQSCECKGNANTARPAGNI